jgi:hypothetical protein
LLRSPTCSRRTHSILKAGFIPHKPSSKTSISNGLPPTSHGKISTCDSACFLAFAETTELPDRRFPASRSVISDGKPSTPVKVVFFRVPLPKIVHGSATPPSASLSRSLPLLACALQHPPHRKVVCGCFRYGSYHPEVRLSFSSQSCRFALHPCLFRRPCP